jgi:hypothetical protein
LTQKRDAEMSVAKKKEMNGREVVKTYAVGLAFVLPVYLRAQMLSFSYGTSGLLLAGMVLEFLMRQEQDGEKLIWK